MRTIIGAACFVVVATAAWAQPPCPTSACAGPAPLLGLGIPAAIAVGGALFGARFFKRK
jgi:hypothetical protein